MWLPLALFLGATVVACSLWPSKPSVLLITIDTLRADRLGCYGHPTNQTPALDRLASEGMLFERAYCDMPWTTGSMASVMTGRYSNEHGLRDPMSKIDPNVVTMAQMFRERGVQTGAIVGSFPLDSIYGLDRGFETYDDEYSMPMYAHPDVVTAPVEIPDTGSFKEQAGLVRKKQHNDWYRPDEDVTTAAIRWFDSVWKGQTFFLWVHYFGPHEKLDGTRNYVQQEPEIIAKYDGDVEATDRAVGRLIEDLRGRGILDDTMVIVHADHGQNLGEHDYVGHTLRLDEVAVRIPLIVRYPRAVTGGTRRREIARNIDILPTALAAWDLPDDDRPGSSLLPDRQIPFSSPAPPADRTAYFETFLPLYFFWPQTTPQVGTLLGPMVSRGARNAHWKLLKNDYRGDCTLGSNPSRDGTGTWILQQPRQLPASQCAEMGATDVFRESIAGAYGLEPYYSFAPLVVSTLMAEIQKYDDKPNAKVGEKIELSPEQTDKLKSLGYLQ